MKNLSIIEMSVIVLISQILFLWLRTVNIKFTTQDKILAAIISGNLIGGLWLLSMAIGVNSLLEGHALPIVMHLIGGTIGTYLGMRKRKGRRFSKKSRGNGYTNHY